MSSRLSKMFSGSASSSSRSSVPPKRSNGVVDSGFIVSSDENAGSGSKNEGERPRKKHKLFSDFRNIYSSYESGKVIGTWRFKVIKAVEEGVE